MSYIYFIKEPREGKFPSKINIIKQYQWKYPSLLKNLHGSFNGGKNTIDIVTYKGKIVITEKIQQ